MADNPYSFMQSNQEDPNDPWRAYQPWQVSTPTIPSFPTLNPSNPIGYGQQPDYTIPGNVDTAGTPATYPGAWGASPAPSGSAGASPFWSLTLPTMFTTQNTTMAQQRARFTNPTMAANGTTAPASPSATAVVPTGNPTGGAAGSLTNPTATPTTTTGSTVVATDPSAQRTVTTPQEWAYWNQPDAQLKGLQTWASVMLPYTQAQQNAYQWGAEYDEANRRYNIDTQWRQQLEQYNADLATRQQQMNELVAQDQSYQWRNEFQRQAANDQFAQDLANRELALAQEKTGRELTLAEQAQVWQQTYQQAQLDIERQQIAAQLEAARYAAFGRSQAPGRYVANWG